MWHVCMLYDDSVIKFIKYKTAKDVQNELFMKKKVICFAIKGTDYR